MKQSARTMDIHDTLTTWCVFASFTRSTFFPSCKRITQSTTVGLAFHIATERGSSSPANVYSLLCPECCHKCCQMNPVLCSYAFLSPSKRTSAFRCMSSKPCVGIDHMQCRSINTNVGLSASSVTVCTKAQSMCKDQQYFSSLF